jgi:plastocyanin
LAKSRQRPRKGAERKMRLTIALLVTVSTAAIISLLFLRGGPVMPVSSSTRQPVSIVRVTIDAGSGSNPNLPGYSPVNVTVVVGENNTVTWVNEDTMPHTVTAFDGSFDSGNLDQGQSFTYMFEKPGTYPYTCVYHHWMHGQVIVLPEGAMGTASTISGYSFAIVLLELKIVVPEQRWLSVWFESV